MFSSEYNHLVFRFLTSDFKIGLQILIYYRAEIYDVISDFKNGNLDVAISVIGPYFFFTNVFLHPTGYKGTWLDRKKKT